MQPDTPEEKEKTKRKNQTITFKQSVGLLFLFLLPLVSTCVVIFIAFTSVFLIPDQNVPYLLLGINHYIPLVVCTLIWVICIIVWSAMMRKWRLIPYLFITQTFLMLGLGLILLLTTLLSRRIIQDTVYENGIPYVITNVGDHLELFVCPQNLCSGTTIYYGDSLPYKGAFDSINNTNVQISISSGDIFCYPLAAINQDITYANYQRQELDRNCPPTS